MVYYRVRTKMGIYTVGSGERNIHGTIGGTKIFKNRAEAQRWVKIAKFKGGATVEPIKRKVVRRRQPSFGFRMPRF